MVVFRTIHQLTLSINIIDHSVITISQPYSYQESEFKYIGLRLLLLRAETCEIVSALSLTADRDMWVEANGLTQARKRPRPLPRV